MWSSIHAIKQHIILNFKSLSVHTIFAQIDKSMSNGSIYSKLHTAGLKAQVTVT